jgi:hypothetical protein
MRTPLDNDSHDKKSLKPKNDIVIKHRNDTFLFCLMTTQPDAGTTSTTFTIPTYMYNGWIDLAQ